MRTRDRRGDDEVSIDIASLGGEFIGLGHGQDEVRRAQLPIRVPLRRRRQIGGCALDRAFRRPLPEETDLIDAQAAFPGEFAKAMLRQPGRHITAGGYLGDMGCALLRILITEQAEWSGLARPMTAGAVL